MPERVPLLESKINYKMPHLFSFLHLLPVLNELGVYSLSVK